MKWTMSTFFAALLPILAGTSATAVTTSEDASGGCDGVKDGCWGFHVASGEQDPWWQVNLKGKHELDRVVVFNRTDSGTAQRTRNLKVLVATERDDAGNWQFEEVYRHNGDTFYGVGGKGPLSVSLRDQKVVAQVVRLAVPGRCSFALDEVEVYATSDPKKNIARGKPADQISISQYSHPGTLPRGNRVPSRQSQAGNQTLDGVVEAGLRLVDRLRPRVGEAELRELADQLRGVLRRRDELADSERLDAGEREALVGRARAIVRQVAWLNPKLREIEALLFIKRHHPGGPYHMCDQYYGCNAVPGGGLYILRDPFGTEPELVDVLEDSVVQNGRLKGRKLTGGSFLSPELSYDGRTIYFAYSEAKARKTYTWNPECCFHIFRVDVDGSNLRQLTDGPYDDFDPCELPGGRIAFISLRRGGYLRCGRHCPTYTLHSMRPDGSDIICLSYHETHEWHPSVTHDGMLAYTRWDYVDRDTNVAHHLWTCFPDGRDPRSNHGNYPQRRESRPWMEMSIRAVPGSHKFVATAAAHHGHALGSLVLIDPRIEDDGAMSQIERLTPDVAFPEAEGGKRAVRRLSQYATPWPLSEDDYLCVYDPAAKNHALYWIDRDGNKALIYRDPKIPSLSPIPLRPRRRPPVIPEQTTQTAQARAARGDDVAATISVMNVYDSDFEWPADTRITHLRVIHVLPKTTPPPNEPRIGVADQTNARAVLGTVPIEADGSAHFEAPVGKAIYFQALDERGMAVQSMRSATYVHPGEQLSCQGCHEPKHAAPYLRRQTPLAMRRAPSPIEPDVEGSNPFNYVRLVQPVLDRNCVGCHQEKGALDLSGTIDGRFTRSYQNLAGKYGFYYNVGNGSIRDGVHGGSRSKAGKIGAQGAPLLKYLDESHYGVKLSPEDFHRITLWLDCNSEFLGAYEDAEAQRRGEVVWPSLD